MIRVIVSRTQDHALPLENPSMPTLVSVALVHAPRNSRGKVAIADALPRHMIECLETYRNAVGLAPRASKITSVRVICGVVIVDVNRCHAIELHRRA